MIASASITIYSIDKDCHLWHDSLYFLQNAIKLENSSEKWYVGTFSRSSILFLTTAFEACCNKIFDEKDFTKRKGKNIGGIIGGIVYFLEVKYNLYLNREDPYFYLLEKCVSYRNILAHGKCSQDQMLNDYDPCLAAKIALILLTYLQHLHLLTNRDVPSWLSTWKKFFKEEVKDIDSIFFELNELEDRFKELNGS